MKKYIAVVLAALIGSCGEKGGPASDKLPGAGPVTIVIHGGAGTVPRAGLTPEKEKEYHAVMKAALDSGYSVLDKGGPGIEAVTASIQVLENSPLFNAGRGAVFTADGTHELDASIMEGKTLRAGAVAGLKKVKNPILAAKAVMLNSPHVMMAGEGAEKFASEQGLQMEEASYFFDSTRYQQWTTLKEKDRSASNGPGYPHSKFGTVGCVVLDRNGNITAGTSTGGMTNKKYGRIGDAPIIGAGTYAKNNTCGVSCTGWGEYYIRLAIAHDISAMMEYKGLSLEEAMQKVIMEKLPALGGDGGAIGLDSRGSVIMKFNTEGMYRGYRREGEDAKTFIYKD